MAAPSTEELTLTSEQSETFRGLASIMKIAAGVLMLLALLYLVSGVLQLFLHGAFGSFLLDAIQAALTGFLGLVLIAGSTDLNYLITTKGVEKIHLTNGINSLGVYCRAVLILSSLFLVVLVCRLVF